MIQTYFQVTELFIDVGFQATSQTDTRVFVPPTTNWSWF